MAAIFQSGACCDGSLPAPSQTVWFCIPYPTPDYNSEQPTAASCRFTSYTEQLTGQNHSLFNYNIAQPLDVSILVTNIESNTPQPCFTKFYERANYPVGTTTIPWNPILPVNFSFGQAIIELPNTQPFNMKFWVSRRCFGCDAAPSYTMRRKWTLTLDNLPYIPDAWFLFNVSPFKEKLNYAVTTINCNKANYDE